MIKTAKKLFEKIEEYRTICIFGHVRPDGDAYGSAMGLKLALDFLFPDKTIYAVVDPLDLVPAGLPLAKRPGTIPEDVIRKSLCITVDTATIDRICDRRALDGEFVIKIDHHPLVEHFGDLEFVDSEKISCSLIIAAMLFSIHPMISPAAAECLLLGLVTDSGGFRFTADPEAYAMAARLIANGADIQQIYDKLNTVSLDSLKLKGKLLSQIKTAGCLAYEVFTKEDLAKMGYTADQIAPRVNTIGNTAECPVWAFFAQYPNGKYRAELRCARNYQVDGVALALGGGGHKQASGAQLADEAAVKKAIQMLGALQPSEA